MSSAPTQISLMLASLFATSPLTLTLLASVLICWRQRDRRPKTAQLLGWASVAYLLWSLVGLRIYHFVIHVMVLDRWPGTYDDIDSGGVGLVLNTVLITLIPATVNAVIWGCALWSILMIDEYQDAPQTGR